MIYSYKKSGLSDPDRYTVLMKHDRGSIIKQEHHIMSDFAKLLVKIAELDHIQRIIPGRISRQQK